METRHERTEISWSEKTATIKEEKEKKAVQLPVTLTVLPFTPFFSFEEVRLPSIRLIKQKCEDLILDTKKSR